MAKIKHKLRDLSILPTFILLSIVFILLAMLLAEVEKTIFSNAQTEIAFQYSNIVEGFNSKKVWGNQAVFWLSQQDSRRMWLYEMCLWLLPPVTYLICFFTAGLTFYRSKIKTPLALLSVASERIADNDLDFSLQYDSHDEMGTLCVAFEKMRSALETNNREMWRQMDERKRLNAAFSHDLRTPLTVLEGHLGILQKYVPDGKLSSNDIIDTYTVMAGQMKRLKTYVTSMNTLQRLEDIPINRECIPTADFIGQLRDTGKIICNGKQLIFLNEATVPTLFLDPEIVMQVFENLLSNAVRYADEAVTIKCRTEQNTLFLSVGDDGKGFDDVALKSATNPFYTTGDGENQHLGIGLNICKILCVRHGGNILLSNGAKKGAIVCTSFDMKK